MDRKAQRSITPLVLPLSLAEAGTGQKQKKAGSLKEFIFYKIDHFLYGY